MHLFMKVDRLPTPHHKVFAWDTVAYGTPSLDPRRVRMNIAEMGEFGFLMERNQHTCIGAGGMYEYRVYELVEAPAFPYAIVYPTITAVRVQYPRACRLVNMRTGQESALCDSLDHAHQTCKKGRTGKLLGAFH